MKRIIFYIVFILIPLLLPAQLNIRRDTIHISEVIISSRYSGQLLPGYKTSSIDSVNIQQYGNRDIGDLLAENSAILIKNYGAGGITVPTFRGTGAGHTQITWNNISINSPMTGQSDLSLIPAGFVDKVNIYFGGGSMEHISGGLGGVIDLGTTPDWKDRVSILVNPSAGSFGRFAGLMKFNAGSDIIQSATRLFIQTARNNFPYINSISGNEPVKEIRQNNQERQNGVVEDLYIKMPYGIISAKVWYQYAFRNLPEPIISMQGNANETQKDESLRGLVNYSYEKGRRYIDLTAALISDNLTYRNAAAAIDSRNNARRFAVNGSYNIRIGERTLIKTIFSEELSTVRTNNYSGIKSRNAMTLGGVAETFLTDWLFARLLLKETADNNSPLQPDISFAFRARIKPEKELFISANISKNSKIPSLNDMYWSPGGNPDLKCESGISSELIFMAAGNISQSVKIKTELTGYYTIISNMIQWKPGNHSFWEAENIGRIRSTGIESSFRLLWTLSSVRITADAGYVLTNATGSDVADRGKQLSYVPRNRFNGILRFDLNHFYASTIFNFSGRRFLTPDNSTYLPGYSVNDINLGAKLILKHTFCDIGVNVTNLFNTSYQSIAWYPMPGRAYLLSIVFQLNNNK